MKVSLPFLLALSLGLTTLSAQVRINEFLASNVTNLTTKDHQHEDWIELYNANDVPIDLAGYYLTDSETFDPANSETFWQFPQGASIGGEGYLIVFASAREASVEEEWHANFRLDRDGERLALIAPDGATILTDFSPYPEQRQDASYGYLNDTLHYMAQPSPGAPNRAGVDGFVEDVQFSVSHGFHEDPFMLTLLSETEGAEIRYTLSDLEPSEGTLFTSPIGDVYDGPIEITKTTVVRAIAKKEGMAPSAIRTRTYLFLDDVIHQPQEPEGFPTSWGSRRADYEMDPEVVGPIYSEEEVKAALLAAPSISLVTENDNLFSRDGIYTNSQAKDLVNDGIDDLWERPVSVEFFGFPHGQTIQANAGIRMQGNASRSPNRMKHNMRIIFRQAYGPGKLQFRLFEDSEVETFNSINLRSNNGDSWIHPGVRVRAQYIRDQWHRYVQFLMGQPSQSQIYAHVYINGLYWGMYHVFERFEASLLSEHFGGDEDDWDALQDTPAFQDIVVNGSDDDFRLTHDLSKADLTVQENYDALLEYVDVDNLIDYLLINFYSGNEDWDHKNMRYGRRRNAEPGAVGSGWLYFAWDSERAGLNGLQSQSLTMNNTNKRTALGPTTLNANMHENPDYHLRFSDRVVRHLFDDGELTPEGAAKSWNDLAQSVYEPLIGESARWGDLHVARPETREGNWQTQLDKENETWFPGRTDVLLDQLENQGFIPNKIPFPQFEPSGGVVAPGMAVSMRIFNNTIFFPVEGDIYYTTNGTDPRLPDGSLNESAKRYDQHAPPVVNHTMTLMARVYDAAKGDWTALSEADFHMAAVPTTESLIFSEIHYAPMGGEDVVEYVELHNRSDKTLDLSGVQITRGIDAYVADTAMATLEPGGHALIVSDRAAFMERYPAVEASQVVATFANDTRLDNAGERLTLRTRSGHLLHTIRYNDKAPWPELTEGGSIAYRGGAGASVAHPGNWVASASGSPGAAHDSESGSVASLKAWLASQGLADAQAPWGPQGEPALLGFAFGLESPEDGFPIGVGLSEDAARVILHYTRRGGRTDLTWEMESSHDLRTWTLVESSIDVLEGDGTHERVRHEASAVGGRYWRLRVTGQP